MKLNKLMKALAIVVPMAVLSACSSTGNTGSDSDMTGTGQDSSVTPLKQEQEMFAQNVENGSLTDEESMVWFAFNDAVVDPSYNKMLELNANYLTNHPDAKIVIQGNTDQRGTPEYNIALGEKRAQAVADYLEALGVNASQISTVSYGEEKPLVQGHTDADYAKNRRAKIVYN